MIVSRQPTVVVRSGSTSDYPLPAPPSCMRPKMLTLPGIGDTDEAALLDALALADEFGAVDDLLARTEGQVEAFLVTPITPIPLTHRVESPLPGPVGARRVAAQKMGPLDYLAGAVEAVTRTLLSALDSTTTAAAR